MARSTIAAGPYADRRRRTQDLRDRYLFAHEVLDFYGAVLVVQEEAYDAAGSAMPAAQDLISYVAEMVMPSVVNASIASGPQKLREAVADRLTRADPREIIAAWIGGEPLSLADAYLARASVGPVLEALGAEVASSCIGLRDARHCPACGGPPQLSYFAVAGEDLAAGGRFLVCARCHASWGYPRMTCPGCGEASSSKLPIFNEEGNASGERGSVVRGLEGRLGADRAPDRRAVFPHIRIEACESCRQYLLNVDLLADPLAVPIVDEVAALPLDLYARDRGFTKIIPNLMGF